MSEDPKKKHGPIFVSAFACEKILREVDGMITPVRLLTAFHAPPIEITFNEDPPRVEYRYAPVYFTIVIIFVSDQSERFAVTLTGKKPDGTALGGGPQPGSIEMEGGLAGASLIYSLNVPSEQEGEYWFDIFIDEDLVSRVPILIFHRSTESYLSSIQQKVPNHQKPIQN